MPAKDIWKAAVAAVGEKIRKLWIKLKIPIIGVRMRCIKKHIYASFILGFILMSKRGKPTNGQTGKNCLILRSVLVQIWETVRVVKSLRLSFLHANKLPLRHLIIHLFLYIIFFSVSF
jgi:hypothetical protein